MSPNEEALYGRAYARLLSDVFVTSTRLRKKPLTILDFGDGESFLGYQLRHDGHSVVRRGDPDWKSPMYDLVLCCGEQTRTFKPEALAQLLAPGYQILLVNHRIGRGGDGDAFDPTTLGKCRSYELGTWFDRIFRPGFHRFLKERPLVKVRPYLISATSQI